MLPFSDVRGFNTGKVPDFEQHEQTLTVALQLVKALCLKINELCLAAFANASINVKVPLTLVVVLADEILKCNEVVGRLPWALNTEHSLARCASSAFCLRDQPSLR